MVQGKEQEECMKVDVIIPVYKPDESLFTLIAKLEEQTQPIQNILLMNTEEKYFEQLVFGSRSPELYGNVRVFHLSKREFDHGGTRRSGVCKSNADYFVMMTQDAMPADEFLIEKLLAAFRSPEGADTKAVTAEAAGTEEADAGGQTGAGQTAVVYARQLPNRDCKDIERCSRLWNYPPKSQRKSLEDLDRLGIKTYFCSNVCAAYSRKIYDDLGGFVKHTIFNEDMLYAAKAVQNGYEIAYAADAKVFHSHNYTCMQQFHRNFDLGVSQAQHPEVFAGVPAEGEGKKLVAHTASYLKEQKKGYLVPKLYWVSAWKYAGYLLGKHYRSLPDFLVRQCSDNKTYWDKKI